MLSSQPPPWASGARLAGRLGGEGEHGSEVSQPQVRKPGPSPRPPPPSSLSVLEDAPAGRADASGTESWVISEEPQCRGTHMPYVSCVPPGQGLYCVPISRPLRLEPVPQPHLPVGGGDPAGPSPSPAPTAQGLGPAPPRGAAGLTICAAPRPLTRVPALILEDQTMP